MVVARLALLALLLGARAGCAAAARKKRKPAATELVMGLATNYEWEHLATFVRSLRASRYRGDLVLFTSPRLSDETRERFDEFGVRAVPVRADADASTLANLEFERHRIPGGSQLPRSVASRRRGVHHHHHHGFATLIVRPSVRPAPLPRRRTPRCQVDAMAWPYFLDDPDGQ